MNRNCQAIGLKYQPPPVQEEKVVAGDPHESVRQARSASSSQGTRSSGMTIANQREQHDVHRQDVEIRGLEMQQQRLEHGAVRRVRERVDMDFLEVVGAVERGRGVRDLGAEHDEQENVGDVEHPGAAQHVRACEQPAVPVHAAAVGEPGGVTSQRGRKPRSSRTGQSCAG